MFSKQANIIQKEKMGYRNDNYYGEKERNLVFIIKHEIMEYGNVDILQTLKDNYEEFSFIDDDLITLINQQSVFEKEIDELIASIITLIKQRLNTSNDLQGIWVCDSKENVEKYYSDGNESIHIITFNEDFLIISDLEDEGILIACKDFNLK